MFVPVVEIIFWVIVNIIFIQCNGQCPNGWFGSKCQFQCHCDNGQCPPGGQCNGQCAHGWFGESCQFRDLITEKDVLIVPSPPSSSISWMTDRNDQTCNTGEMVRSITLTWNNRYFISSVRLFVNNEELVMDVVTNCGPPTRVVQINNRTVEYRCNKWSTEPLTLSGAGLQSLCSLYVNGGRNVALNQKATQTSVMPPFVARLAVDGNRDGHQFKHSCTHTDVQDASPSWTLELDTPKIISSIVIHNRLDCCSERLNLFQLRAMGSKGDVVFTYNDTSLGRVSVYNVTKQPSEPIVQVTISAVYNTQSPKYGDKHAFLTLCEVELYGDCAPGAWGLECNKTCVYIPDCAPGAWGLECNKTCPTQCNDSCHQENGQCLACLGYSDPPECSTECSSGQWGLNCHQVCSTRCFNEVCNSQTGLCEHGCSGSINFPYCDTECPKGKWGVNCTLDCDVRCWAKSCHPVNGQCNAGCNGYSDPPYCTAVCSPGSWGGPNCIHNCSTGCYSQLCDSLNGQCQAGCDGYSDPPLCQTACDIHHWGINCSRNCSQTCFNGTCNSVTGLCDYGCNVYTDMPFCSKACVVNSFLGDKCSEETTTVTLTFEHGVSIGIATGVLVMVIIDAIIVCVLCVKRGRREDTGLMSMQYNKLVRPQSTAPAYTEMSVTGTSCSPERDTKCDWPEQDTSTNQCQQPLYEPVGGLCIDSDNVLSGNVNIYDDLSHDTHIYANM